MARHENHGEAGPATQGYGREPVTGPGTAAEPPVVASGGASVQRNAWTRLASAFRPRVKRGHLLPALLCAVLGFAVVVQVRSTQDTGLDGLRQTDLVRILDDVTERANRLRQEARDLEDTRAAVTAGSGGSLAALQEARDIFKKLLRCKPR